MAYTRTSFSPVATISKPSSVALTALPSPSRCCASPSTQLGPSKSDVSIRVRRVMTHTLRPSSPRVSICSLSMESPDV